MFLRPLDLSESEYLEDTGAMGDAGATFSPCQGYRYHLWRWWGDDDRTDRRTITFLMCNPSTADAFIVDPTVRKCLHFARRDGYQGAEVLNIFALRSTDPAGLLCDDPIGRLNDDFIRAIQGTVCVAWGGVGAKVKGHKDRPAEVLEILSSQSVEIVCLGRNGDGTPKHPCYLRNTTELEPWKA